jgi:hypothetical protein
MGGSFAGNKEKEFVMKHKVSSGVFTSSLLLLMFLSASVLFAKEPAAVTLHGEIMDSQCAYDVHSVGHSHDAMTKKGIYGSDAKTCTSRCVKENGGIYVLVVKDDVYKLDDQTQLEQFSGKKVKLSGTIDEKTPHKIHVLKIEEDTTPAATAPPASH